MPTHRTQPDLTWVNGYVVPSADWQDLNSKVFDSINGDLGGTWGIKSNTLTISGVSGGNLQVSGRVDVLAGGTLIAALTLADNDFQDLAPNHVGRTRTIATSLLGALQTTPGMFSTFLSFSHLFDLSTQPTWQVNSQFMGLQSIGLTLTAPDGVTGTVTPQFDCPLRVHNGATISQVDVVFRVSPGRASAPVKMPRVRVIRRDMLGNSVVLKSAATDTLGITRDADKFISPKNPGTVAGWYNDGNEQTLSYICDENNVVDNSQYTYWLQVIEETGATQPPWKLTMFPPVRAASTPGVPAPPFDGDSGFANFDPYLVKDAGAAANNGVFFNNGVGVVYANSANGGVYDPAPGMLIWVGGFTGFFSGTYKVVSLANRGTYWRLTNTGKVTPGVTPQSFVPHQPTGNIYMRAIVHHTNILTTAWQ